MMPNPMIISRKWGVAGCSIKSVVESSSTKVFDRKVKQRYRTPAGEMMIPHPTARQEFINFPDLFGKAYPGTQPLPGLETIGCGYDIFGSHVDFSGLKRRLLDPKKISGLGDETVNIGGRVFSSYPIVTVHSGPKNERRTFHTETGISMAMELSARGGVSANVVAFQGSVEMNYDAQYMWDMYSSFTNIFDTHISWTIGLNDRDDLRDFVSDDAIDAIDTWDPFRLFDEFGLYFLTGIVIGGRLNYITVTDIFRYRSKTSVAQAAETSFLLGIVKGSGSTLARLAVQGFQSVSQERLVHLGGDERCSVSDPKSYDTWKKSIPSRPVFVDLTDPTVKRPLTPIWSLAAKKERRTELEKAAKTYASEIGALYHLSPDAGSRRFATYVVTIHTGVGGAAGTDNPVYVEWRGVDRMGVKQTSGRIKHDDARDNHNKGAIDAIEFGGIRDVGELTEVILVHGKKKDPKRGPAWQVSKVEIVCNEYGKMWWADCRNTWLNVGSAKFPLQPRL